MAPTLCLAVTLAVSGQAVAWSQGCRGNQQSMLAAELFFGRTMPGGGFVGEAAWARFLAREITPRFPDGLTVFDAAGQWRDRAGRIVRQASKVVLIVFRDDPQKQESLDAIANAYRRRFKQQSVGIVVKPACASF